jgi:LmbE family N-acetylglucosaminyl deacetylase
MANTTTNMVITAHPDDETLFFGGMILSRPDEDWTVVCLTDGNADDRGNERMAELDEACELLGVQSVIKAGFEDTYNENLDQRKLKKFFNTLPDVDRVFTHGPLGEYGHPHHIQTAFAVHKFFTKKEVWHPAINCFASKREILTEEQYNRKLEILAKVYDQELMRFSRFIHFPSEELYTQSSLDEVEKLAHYLLSKEVNEPTGLVNYKAFKDHLAFFRSSIFDRAF